MMSDILTDLPILDAQATTHAENRIAGERAILELITNIKSGITLPGDLTLALSSLDGPAFHGACRVIEETLEFAMRDAPADFANTIRANHRGRHDQWRIADRLARSIGDAQSEAEHRRRVSQLLGVLRSSLTGANR